MSTIKYIILLVCVLMNMGQNVEISSSESNAIISETYEVEDVVIEIEIQESNNKVNNKEESVLKYEFEDIEMIPVNNNEVSYVAEPVSMIEDSWLTNFAGGKDKQFDIKIGKVNYNNGSDNIEPYIVLKNEKETITLIANGYKNEFYEGTSMIKRRTINFLTGKRLEGKEVIKDYSNGKIKLTLVIDYDLDGVGKPVSLYCSNSDYMEEQLQNNFYKMKVKK